MAQTSAGDMHHGDMDVHDQRETFSGFLSATVWTGALIVQAVALLVLAFAIGAGWWAGFAAFAAIGVAVGLLFKMPGAWWASQVALWVVMAIGGLVVPALAGMMG